MAENQGISDFEKLIGMLDIVERYLFIITHERKELFLPEYRDMLPGPWDKILPRFREAQEALKSKKISMDHLASAGLVGEELDFKYKMLFRTAEAAETATVAPRTRQRKGFWGRFLKLVNSFLGSLARALPVLEPVKEYKENVEAAIGMANE